MEFKQQPEKKNYKLPVGYDMWDNLHCIAKCATPCGRNVKPKPLETYADLSLHCSSFTSFKNEIGEAK